MRVDYYVLMKVDSLQISLNIPYVIYEKSGLYELKSAGGLGQIFISGTSLNQIGAVWLDLP